MANNYNMRRLSIAVITALLSVTASHAYDFEVDGIYYNITSETDLEVEVCNYNYHKYSGYVVIPGNVLYDNCSYSVTGIGKKAFYNCTSLTSVEIPNSVTSIGECAFMGCDVTSVEIPYGVTSIEDETFSCCSELMSIVIPNSVTSIGDEAFRSCWYLTNVEIGSSVTSIGKKAFFDCRHNLTSIVIPSSVTSIGDMAFTCCDSLTSIGVDENNEYYSSFKGVLFDKDKETLICYPAGKKYARNTIPETVTAIGDYAFYCYYSLTCIEIPSSVTSIGSYAFYDCHHLTSVEIPYGVTSIGKRAFYYCVDLTSVEIPNSVTSIGSYAFEHCEDLTSVVISNSITSVENGTFYECEALTSVEIPYGVTSIGKYAFYGCHDLTSVEIPNSVTSIGECAFMSCYDLTSVVIPYGVTSIEDETFEWCSDLKSVEIPNSVISIGENAFNNCDDLKSVVIPNSVTSIGKKAFYYCDSLADVYSLNVTPSTSESNKVFDSSTLAYATLHVPSSAVDNYNQTKPWKFFSKTVGIETSYSVGITVSEEDVTVGESMTLISTIEDFETDYLYTDTVYAWYVSVDDGEAELIDDAATDSIKYTPVAAGTYGFYCSVSINDVTINSDKAIVKAAETETDDDTGISGITMDETEEYSVYSLDGVLLMKTKDSLEIESLPEGIYIVNGKKVAIKR